MAFVEQILDAPGRDRVLPVFQGAELAFAGAALSSTSPVAVDLVPVDVAADPAALADIAADPGFVAAIVAPDVLDTVAIRELLDAGMAVVDLAPFGRAPLPVDGAWRRLVPPLGAQAAVLAKRTDGRLGSRASICLVEDPLTAIGLLRPIARDLRHEVALASSDPGTAAEAIRGAGCRRVVWDGDGAVGSNVI
ncbi:MAG TPA: hypothetical protein VE669_02045, partial [Actinomycetota bacterium]|nr:hypothetical protein [Actinomycetota bacterium]